MTAPLRPKANILVVDDTIENLRLLSSMLSECGYEVRPVTNGRQALQAVERDPPDLVLLDINMPEMNGYEVCSRLKANPAVKDVPVVFLTALGDIADKVKAFDVGGIDYITKPFQLEEVQARVKTHVALRHASVELSLSYEKLASLEKLRDNLVHMIVHDMRSPLTVLAGHLELLCASTGSSLDEDARADLNAARKSARVLTGMANDLLDVSRLEEQRLPIRLDAHDVGVLVAEVTESLRHLERARTIELCAAPSLLGRCDAEILRRIVENLLSNAIKHTPAGESIRVSVASEESWIRIEVRDNGRGVPPEARERIFERFGALETRTAGKYHSAGLGLSFCKLAIEALGGAIGVRDGDPRGSVFWCSVPKV